MKYPCLNCPFRSDKPLGTLKFETALFIIDSLNKGAPFYCHKTIDYYEDGYELREDTSLCVGAAGFVQNVCIGGLGASPGFKDVWPEDLDPNVPVYSNMEDFIRGACEH